MKAKDKEESGKKITRRVALKRIALATGSIGVLGSLHSWGTPRTGVGLGDLNQPGQEKVAAYYSWYDRYARYYSTYYKYISVSYSDYKSTYQSYGYVSSSPYPPTSRGGGCTRSD